MAEAHRQDGRWLSIIGIGEDGVEGLSPRAMMRLRNAERVFGGKRHLALAAPLIGEKGTCWPSPFQRGIDAVLAARGQRVAVLASGDPMAFGVGATLARHVPAEEMEVIPRPSSMALAAARLGWALAETGIVSLHGRDRAGLIPALQPGARLIVLTSGVEDLAPVAALLRERGFGGSRVTLLEALGGPREQVRVLPMEERATLPDADPLHLLAIECVADTDHRALPLTAGRDEALFQHDGQISKREVRATILALLAPHPGELLWDVGAGSGSVGIEWMLAHPSLRAIAIEARADRAERIRRNAGSFGVPGLTLIEGKAPDALAGLPPPDAIFIGGGATAPGLIDGALATLRPGGRLVASAVTLETEALLTGHQARQGGDLVRLSIARAAPIGGMTGWRPARPVTLWSWRHP